MTLMTLNLTLNDPQNA